MEQKPTTLKELECNCGLSEGAYCKKCGHNNTITFLLLKNIGIEWIKYYQSLIDKEVVDDVMSGRIDSLMNVFNISEDDLKCKN